MRIYLDPASEGIICCTILNGPDSCLGCCFRKVAFIGKGSVQSYLQILKVDIIFKFSAWNAYLSILLRWKQVTSVNVEKCSTLIENTPAATDIFSPIRTKLFLCQKGWSKLLFANFNKIIRLTLYLLHIRYPLFVAWSLIVQSESCTLMYAIHCCSSSSNFTDPDSRLCWKDQPYTTLQAYRVFLVSVFTIRYAK